MLYSVISGSFNGMSKSMSVVKFIPLTFIVGVYGMNFDPNSSPWNMPELRSRYGYPITMGCMGVLVLGMLVYFYRKGWIGNRPIN